MPLKIIREADGSSLGDRILLADTFWKRLRGLMFHPGIGRGEGLLIEPCTSIHMMFMRFPIDAVFLDTQNRVVALYHTLKPWLGFSGWHRNAAKVVELPAGTLAGANIQIGDKFFLERIA